MPTTVPQYVDTAPAEAYRREGYAEVFSFSEGTDPVSFGAGGYSARLELYSTRPRPGVEPVLTVSHVTGDTESQAVVAVTPAQLASLTLDSYYRQLWIVTPDGEEIILSDSMLYLKQ